MTDSKSNTRRRLRRAIVSIAMVLSFTGWALADDDLDRRASWQLGNDDSVAEQVTDWLQAQELEKDVLNSGLSIWEKDADGQLAGDRLQRAVGSFMLANSEIAELVNRCQSPASVGDLPDFDLLESEELAPLVRDNLRLYIGKWLAISGMYDECVDVLSPLEVDQVAAPESLLFYRSVAHYRLRNKEEGLAAIEQLLENKDGLPRRYIALSELMQAELDSLEPDSLDEISRIMDSVRVRLGLGRAGTRVRKEEDEIVEKLDKKIEELEQQRQQQQQQQQSGNNAKGNQAQNPADDSSLPSGQASPEVDPRRLASETEWGDLPPKAREEALQSLGKEFPSHYREVIEEYFRKIARDEVQTP